MGLHMKNTLLALFALVTLTSCLQPKQSKEEDLGQKAEGMTVAEAMITAWGDASPLSIAKGEFMYLEQTQKVNDMPAEIMTQVGFTIADKITSPEEVRYRLIQQMRSFAGGNKETFTKERDLIVKLESDVVNEDQVQALSDDFPISVQIFQYVLGNCFKEEGYDVECYNLRISSSMRPAPDLVRNRPDCGGLPNCQMEVRKITYDAYFTVRDPSSGGTSREKVEYLIEVGANVPYLSRLLNYCQRGLFYVEAAKQKVLAEICYTVKDFRPQQTSP